MSQIQHDLPLWKPSDARLERSPMTHFKRFVNERFNQSLDSYADLQKWSVNDREGFWRSIWDFCGVVASNTGDAVATDSDSFENVAWFPEARLNFAENLLRYNDDKVALIGLGEDGARREITYAGLRVEVAAVAAGLKAAGVKPGDRVAAFMPNIIETVVGMLASASLGATWTSCSPDFGLNGARDRFGQVEPKVLFTADGYRYNGKCVDSIERASALASDIPSIEKVVAVNFVNTLNEQSLPANFVAYDDFKAAHAGTELCFAQLPFDHPLYILYSSGTTGVPKCIVHGAGGTLLQHQKEHVLHTELTRDDVLFYFTTCGWMMWNWLVSALATGCTLVLYDGSPFANDGDILLDAIDREGISVFGVSAKYIDAIDKAGKTPAQTYSLASLKTIMSTGSPLSRHSFEWIYSTFKQDVCLSSVSGGTDIVSCFVSGTPTLPVYAGEIQCVALGMATEFWNDEGKSLKGEKGELVCTKPFPSAPVGFWNDPDGERYHNAYFSRFPNIWAHGDYGEINERGGSIIHGRSDAVLNPGGVRIGTAEIYRQVEKISDIIDSVVIGQRFADDERVVLFVVMREGVQLDEQLEANVRSVIRQNATPRHVPAVIVQVPEIPKTRSGKVVEIAVKNVVHGEPVKNTDALANPEALDYFRNLPLLQT